MRYVADEVAGRDKRTRYQGVFARHRAGCPVEVGRRCNCSPSYYGKAYDRETRRHVSTQRFPKPSAARAARADLVKALERGEFVGRSDMRVRQAVERFTDAARSGVVLNKRGRRYKPSAVKDLDNALSVHLVPELGAKRLSDVRRRDMQAVVDRMTSKGLSGSRVRSVVNATRSLYRWAQERELVTTDPARLVRLPAMDATPRDRVATPVEFAGLLEVLPPKDALPYALAGYGSARRAEITYLRWGDLDLDAALLELGADTEARKYGASHRIVPILRPLSLLLRREYFAQGRPGPDELVCPPRKWSKSGRLHSGELARRAVKRWEEHDPPLRPIGLHESRHTFASWCDAAGVSPKTASVLMGHAIPERQAGAAAITLERYTHALPDHVERARTALDGFLEDELAEAVSQ